MSHHLEDRVKKSKPMRGIVTSDKMNKSRVATVNRLIKDKRYNKYVKRRTKIMFHDENNETKKGDQVLIMPCRPHSAHKKFDLLKVVAHAIEG